MSPYPPGNLMGWLQGREKVIKRFHFHARGLEHTSTAGVGWTTFSFLSLSLSHMHAHTDTCTQGETVPLSYHKYSSCQGVPHGLGTRLTGWSWLPSIWLHTHTYQGVLLLLSEPEHCCCPPHGPPQPPPVFSMSASQTSPPERRRRTDTHTTLYTYTIC